MTGSDAVTYASFEEFHAAVDNVSEIYHFESSKSSMEGFSAVIAIMSNNAVTAGLCTEHEGAVVAAHQDIGIQLAHLQEGAP